MRQRYNLTKRSKSVLDNGNIGYVVFFRNCFLLGCLFLVMSQKDELRATNAKPPRDTGREIGKLDLTPY